MGQALHCGLCIMKSTGATGPPQSDPSLSAHQLRTPEVMSDHAGKPLKSAPSSICLRTFFSGLTLNRWTVSRLGRYTVAFLRDHRVDILCIILVSTIAGVVGTKLSPSAIHGAYEHVIDRSSSSQHVRLFSFAFVGLGHLALYLFTHLRINDRSRGRKVGF